MELGLPPSFPSPPPTPAINTKKRGSISGSLPLRSLTSHQAVCCEDGRHCCPSGHQCTGHHKCSAGGFTFPWYATVAASSNQVSSVSCSSSSPAASVCVCPQHLTRVTAHLCPPQKKKLRSALLAPPTPPTPLSDVPCDETTSCEDGQTCCRLSASQWGCCPLPHVRQKALATLARPSQGRRGVWSVSLAWFSLARRQKRRWKRAGR